MRIGKNILTMILFGIFPMLALAKSVGVGGMATDMMEPVGVMADFLHSACILIGGAFLFASIIKYIEHRRSPTMVPMSTVVFLVIAGAFLLAIPILSYITNNGGLFSK
jgi:hypothetical protein